MTKGSLKILERHTQSSKSQSNWTKNNKSRMQDVYDVLESVAWLWRILGVFPLMIEEPIVIKRYTWNKYLAAYSLLVCGMCLGNFLYVMIWFDFYFRGPFRINSATLLVQSGGSILSLFTSAVYRLPQHGALSELINSIAEKDRILNKMNCRSDYKFSVKILRAYVWTSLLAPIFFVLYDVNGIRRTYSIISVEYILWKCGLLIQAIDLTVFATSVGLLGMTFQNLNKGIQAVVTRANATPPKALTTSDDCAEQLRFISKTHYDMCAIGKRINRIFDWNMIINVTIAFVILSTTMYYIFYEVQRTGETDLPQIVSYIHWEAFHSVPIIIVVMISNLTSHQSVVAGKLIHEIRVKNTDSELYQAVKSFSLQLHHQKLEFTARGFFPIDSTLLQTMIGKMTTYLVILIQFNPKLD